ncbi:electron transfer flavoprotein, alpha subunit [Pelotomaculum thermopropionicum SI]|uniref:Electron transfer flavoprotein, alpha subunit n=1 Tax=Pelotomaculum thermopropionicum (strain DSM 13744 / JCM 10971 / SI) TaxID=370438 RepID=A5D4R9_PELTS|nr:electron transfer flavoprotein, alpha subunit [Pelotomaculum thermopropionicum SI]
MQKILLVLDQNGEGIDEPSLNLCTSVKRFARRPADRVEAVLFGPCQASLSRLLGGYGVRRVYQAPGPAGYFYSPERRAKQVLELAEAIKPSLIVLPGTVSGREIAPLLALKLEAGLVSDCVQLSFEGGKTEAVVSVYNGRYQMVCEFTGSPNVVLMADVDCGEAETDNFGDAEVVLLDDPGFHGKPALEVLEAYGVPAGEIDIGEADVVVGIGGGIKTAEDFKMMKELAAALGAAVGGTRAAVDAGWIPRAGQIGQTGRAIAPLLYLAAGVSGAPQHISGVKKGKIVAVNCDPQAPVFDLAALGAVGDFREIVPLLIQKLRRGKGRGNIGRE